MSKPDPLTNLCIPMLCTLDVIQLRKACKMFKLKTGGTTEMIKNRLIGYLHERDKKRLGECKVLDMSNNFDVYELTLILNDARIDTSEDDLSNTFNILQV